MLTLWGPLDLFTLFTLMSALSPQKVLFNETKILLLLAIPLMLGQVIESSNGFFTTILIAHLNHHALAAGALVSNLFITLMVFMWGVLVSISSLVAQKHGANDAEGVAQIVRDGLCLAALLVIPAMALLWNAAPLLLFFGQHPHTVTLARAYLHGLAWSIPADFYSIVILQFIIGLGHSRVLLFFNLIWIPISLLCSYVLMFGKWGFTAMGITGTGWGWTIGMWFASIALTLYIFLNPNYRRYLLGHFKTKSFRYLGEILKVGLPLAGMFCIEVSFFMAMALLMGHISSQTLAANQIVLQYVGLLSGVLSFCLAQALTVRVGHTTGAGDIIAAKRASYIGAIIAVACMLLIGLCYWFVPYWLIAVDLDMHAAINKAIVNDAKHFFMIAAIFQIVEAVRIALFGSLRGLNDTSFTMLTSLLSFWGVAFPLGYFLAIHQHWGGNGVWWGMVLGAVCGVALLFWRLEHIFKIYYAKNCLSN
jgi:MATE family multidrug resistance protein